MTKTQLRAFQTFTACLFIILYASWAILFFTVLKNHAYWKLIFVLPLLVMIVSAGFIISEYIAKRKGYK